MVELFPERRRAELFARALDGHAAPADARIQELLDTATRLAAVPLVRPRAEFRDSLRTRLMEAAAAELPAQAAARATETVPEVGTGSAPAHRGGVTDDPRAARRRHRLVAVATGLVIIGGGTGVAAASEQALPGDMLYPVKRTLESAEVGIAHGDASEGRAVLERATTRLDEVQALSADLAVGGPRPESSEIAGVESALNDFTADAATGGSRLLQSYSESHDPADLRALRDFTADSHSVLTGLSGTLPPQAQSLVSAADDTLVRLDTTAKMACPDCTAAPPLQGLPTEPAVLPDVATRATPDVPATTTQHRPDRPAPGRHAKGTTKPASSPSGQPTPSAGSLLPLPDLNLGDTGGQTQQGTSSGQTGGSGTQQDPTLNLGDVLSPPSPQRTVDAPLPQIPHRLSGDLGNVTGPLTEPLPSLLDGTSNTAGNTVDNSGDGLGGLIP